MEEAILRHGKIVRIADHQPMWSVKVAQGSTGKRQTLIVKEVSATLTGTSLIQLIRALRAADIINGLGPCECGLEIQTVAQSVR